MASQASHMEDQHPSWQQYVKIGAVLAIITAIEVAIVYIDALDSVLVPMLLALSVTKFVLVVGYFMHLKFDDKLFRWIFVGGLSLAIGIVIALMALFGEFA